MKIHLDYRNPTPSHCDVAVFIDGALTGKLTLRQNELIGFQQVIVNGMHRTFDSFTATGDPDPVGGWGLRELVTPPWRAGEAMKTNGPGKYDAAATFVRIQTDAECVAVIVIGGTLGSGFSVQGTNPETIKALPDMLETMARDIRKEIQDDEPTT